MSALPSPSGVEIIENKQEPSVDYSSIRGKVNFI